VKWAFTAANPSYRVGGVFSTVFSLTAKEVTMQKKLYVGNLSYNITEDDLRALFSQAGTVDSVALIKDRTTGMSRGFAFIEMDSQASAQKAITLFNEFKIHDHQLAVSLARQRKERGRPPQHNRHNKRGGGRRRY
jgi:RNA recognition motif-containing protein